MEHLKVNFEGKDYVYNLPTMRSEVNVDYLQSLVANVNLAPYYSLVAILIKETPMAIVSAIKQNKNATVNGIAIMIKHNKDNEFINNIKAGDVLNVAGSDLAIGYHVAAKYNSLTPSFLTRLAISDTSVYNQCINIRQATYFVEFKIIPNNAIHAAINGNAKPIVDCYFVEDNNKKD